MRKFSDPYSRVEVWKLYARRRKMMMIQRLRKMPGTQTPRLSRLTWLWNVEAARGISARFALSFHPN
jgi:hypothetical protein